MNLRELFREEQEHEAHVVIFGCLGILAMCAVSWLIMGYLAWHDANGTMPTFQFHFDVLKEYAEHLQETPPARGAKNIQRLLEELSRR